MVSIKNEETSEFIDLVRTIVKQELNKLNIEYVYTGIINSINQNNTYDVEIPQMGVCHDLINKTGEALTVGDAVLIRTKNKNFGNAYIGIKNGNTTP